MRGMHERARRGALMLLACRRASRLSTATSEALRSVLSEGFRGTARQPHWISSTNMASPAAPADGVKEVKESRGRRDLLLTIQATVQQKWEEAKVFESDAPTDGKAGPDDKYFGTFPYPYMNGLLHLGHAFSLSKLEFASAYHRLCGKRVLFPQGFHCTGMPIKACADRLTREVEKYGLPPVFPTEEEVEAAAAAAATATGTGTAGEAAAAADAAAGNKTDPTKFAGKKSKAMAKKGISAYQWRILQSSEIPDEEIPSFRDPAHWLQYFPPKAMRDMQAMGCGVDWRRSFITTDVNPYYDSFVRWQFWTLYNQGKITKDKRLAIYSKLDGQPCADHDRATGEGAAPQDYTLIKMEAAQPLTGKLAQLGDGVRVFLLAATLRPETMYGQTNAWVLPDGQYGAFKGLNNEVYVITQRAANNMSFQEKLPVPGEPELLLALSGQDLIGTPLKSPRATHERIYVLPLLTILTSKGTGVVTSVPSDSPDDYAALVDLKKKPKLREKYGVLDEWVLPFEVIPIIDIPGFGSTSAVKVYDDLKISSQNDAAKLAEAKGMVYLKGFTDGVMVAGPYAGRPVKEVKPIIRDELIAEGLAMSYSEPDKQVISRSGDECVVALTDQWYMAYGEEQWLALTRQALGKMELYSADTRAQFDHCMGWLQQWACSRSFGLGTRLPWDPQYLIESLSDSTVYMAYYTVAHLLQPPNDMYGTPPAAGSGVRPEDLTLEVWNYIFLEGPLPAECAISTELLQRLRAEFNYWYPFDLRVSGKDLIQNHLTFALYNHTAIWEKDESKWPRSMRCNGHLLLNSEKMSKSTGNFKTLTQAIQEYSADAMRWALADAGDGLDDANFETTTANAAILRLTKEMVWIEEMLSPDSGLADGPPTALADRIFANELDIAIMQAKAAYEKMAFRDALRIVAYDLGAARDVYRVAAGDAHMNRQLIQRFIEANTLMMLPITPHTSEYIWSHLLKKSSMAVSAGWPVGGEPDMILQRAARYVELFINNVRKAIIKAEAPPKKKTAETQPKRVVQASVFVSERFVGWQERALNALRPNFDADSRTFGPATTSAVLAAAAEDPGMAGVSEKLLKQQVLPFAKAKQDEAILAGVQVLDVKLPFEEVAFLQESMPYILRSLALRRMDVHMVTDAAAIQSVDTAAAAPGSPVVVYRVVTVAEAEAEAGSAMQQ